MGDQAVVHAAEVLLCLAPPKHRDLDRPAVVSLERLVPPDHVYRQLDAALDLSVVRSWIAECYADRGRPSIDPEIFFRFQSGALWAMFFEGIRSERQLVELASLNLAHRWYLGYHLNEPLPDRSSLVKIQRGHRLLLPHAADKGYMFIVVFGKRRRMSA
jgi:transposase